MPFSYNVQSKIEIHMKSNNIRIAICMNNKMFNHSGSWTNTWIEYCQKNEISFSIVDCYQPDIMDKLKNFDCLLWHVNNYVLADMMVGRSVLYAAKNMGLKTFPDFNNSWHFDDKIAETYLLQSVGAPIPNSYMFYLLDDCINWLKKEASYPLVAKLRSGSGSNNVRLIKNRNIAVNYARHMFTTGYKTYPSMFLKAKSQFNSSKNWEEMKSRMKRIPEFFQTLSRAKEFSNERGYAYFQEFVPNDGYDLKIVVIKDKLCFFSRNVRKNDFRASGGGDTHYNKNFVTKDIISSAFSISDKLGFTCMGYDYVVNKITGQAKIIEISYGFSHKMLLGAKGYYDRAYVWHDEPLNAPEEIIKYFLNQYSGKSLNS